MGRRLALVSVLVLLGACGSDNRQPVDVTIDTFNVALAGAFIPYEAERRQPVADAIATMDSDIVCLEEVWTQADKELIRDAAAPRFPHVVLFQNDLDTVVDDPTDQMGNIPPAPVTVPCPDVEVGNGVTVTDQMNAAVDCVVENCSTIPGSDEGRTTSAGCAGSACVGAVAPLLFGDAQQQRCYACVVTQLPTSQLKDIRASCPEVVNQDLAFGGQNGVMILSRYPLTNAVDWVLPGTWNRRVIVRATAELPNGAKLDVYCNHLTPIFDDFTFPYTGQYGDGNTGAAGWEAEQLLQAQKLIDYVERTSGSTPAVILGDLNAGRADESAGIVAEGQPTLDLLESVFPAATAASYAPLCTFCESNPISGATSSVWIDHILLYGLESSTVQSTTRTFDENVVPVGEGELVPLSDHYGLRSVIRVP